MPLGSVQETWGSIYNMIQNGEGGQAYSVIYIREHYPAIIFK